MAIWALLVGGNRFFGPDHVKNNNKSIDVTIKFVSSRDFSIFGGHLEFRKMHHDAASVSCRSWFYMTTAGLWICQPSSGKISRGIWYIMPSPHIDSFTVLYNPNGRHLPAVMAMQGDCQWPFITMGILTGLVNPKCIAIATFPNTSANRKSSLILHLLTSPTATWLGLCNSLPTTLHTDSTAPCTRGVCPTHGKISCMHFVLSYWIFGHLHLKPVSQFPYLNWYEVNLPSIWCVLEIRDCHSIRNYKTQLSQDFGLVRKHGPFNQVTLNSYTVSVWWL